VDKLGDSLGLHLVHDPATVDLDRLKGGQLRPEASMQEVWSA
jgi:hypothetical protein